MGLKVGDFTIMEYYSGGGIIGLLSYIDDNSMTTLKWSYGFDGGQSYYGLGTVENSVKKIPNRDIKKVGDTYYIREKCSINTYTNIIRSRYSDKGGKLRMRNLKIINKIKELETKSQSQTPLSFFIIHKVMVMKNGLDVKPFKIVVKRGNKKEKIKINV